MTTGKKHNSDRGFTVVDTKNGRVLNDLLLLFMMTDHCGPAQDQTLNLVKGFAKNFENRNTLAE
jgi:hypothetical protein